MDPWQWVLSHGKSNYFSFSLYILSRLSKCAGIGIVLEGVQTQNHQQVIFKFCCGQNFLEKWFKIWSLAPHLEAT